MCTQIIRLGIIKQAHAASSGWKALAAYSSEPLEAEVLWQCQLAGEGAVFAAAHKL
jgi:hypothetical protein